MPRHNRDNAVGESETESELVAALRQLVIDEVAKISGPIFFNKTEEIPIIGEVIRPAILGASRYLDWAKKAYQQRQYRKIHLNHDIFGEPCWDILLELYIAFHECRKVSTKAACIASDVPFATALRNLLELEQLGLVQRIDDVRDKRVKWVCLTKKAISAISRICEAEIERKPAKAKQSAARQKVYHGA